MISEQDRTELADRGIIRIDNLIPEELVTPARDLVYKMLTRAGFWRDDTWIKSEDEFLLRKSLKAFKSSARSNAFRNILTGPIMDMASQLVDGRAVCPMSPHLQLLFTEPNATHWAVPHNIWHLDLARLGDLDPPGVQMFTFLDKVPVGGGGTLLVAGSHRLLNDVGVLGSKEVKKRLSRKPYFRDLMDRNLPDRERFINVVGNVDDVPLQVVELTGNPGDVYFTDLRLLHSLGPNTSNRPRMMITQRFLLESVSGNVGDVYKDLALKRSKT